jgi:hypothetical protein
MLTANINQALIFNVIFIGLFSIIVIDSTKLILSVLMSIESITRAVKEYFKEKGEKVKKSVKGLGEKVKKAVKVLGEKIVEKTLDVLRELAELLVEKYIRIADIIIIITLVLTVPVPPFVRFLFILFATFRL